MTVVESDETSALPPFFGRISLPATAELRSGVASRGITAPLERKALCDGDDSDDADTDMANPEADADADADNDDDADADVNAEEEDADTDTDDDGCTCC